MQITVQFGEVTLALPDDILNGWAPALKEQVQEIPLFRAVNSRLEPKGNALVTYTFTVSRGHADLAAAVEWLDDLPRVIRNANRATSRAFTKSGGVGARQVRLELANCQFQAEPVKGIRTTIHYTVTGSLPAEVI